MTEELTQAVIVRGTEILPGDDRQRYREKIARITLDSTVQLVSLLDKNGRVLEINPLALDAAGITLADVEGQPFWTTFWWQVSEQVNAGLQDAIARAANGEFVRWDAEIYRTADDKETIFNDISLMPIRDDQGQIVFLCVEGRDITQTKAYECEIARQREELAELNKLKAQFFANISDEFRTPRECETRYRAIVEVSQECVKIVAPDGTLLQMNSAGLTMVEGDESTLGQSVYNLIAPEFRDAYRIFNEQVCRGERGTLEFHIIGLKGTRRHVESTAIPLPATGGGFTHLAVTRDVTFRRRAESELRDIRSRMEAALAGAAIGTWSWDIPEDRFYADPSLARIFALPPEVVSGGSLSHIVDSIHPDDRAKVKNLVSEAVASGHYYEADYRVAQPNGTWRWVTARGQVERDARGHAIRFPGVVIDITDRKHAEEELERVTAESERRKRLYETILSATPDFVYVFSLDYHVLYANDSLVSMWGVGDPVGRTFLEIGYEQWHAEMHCREIDMVRSTKKPIRGEVPFSGTNGRKIYDYIFVPVFGLDGEVEAVAGTTRDVTDRKAMEEELRDTDRRKDEFIALLAHELRNPLAPIRNGLQVLRLAEGDPRAIADARAMMDRQLSHMVRLIDDLLDISRINRNKMELRRSRVTLADVVASAVETAQPQIEQASHELSLTLPAVPIHLDADLTRLAQVFSNLLTNSAKYTEPGGRIWLSAERTGRDVEVSVRDNGIGIPPTSLSNIFDMFSQVDRAMERSTGGLGIGLSLVKGLVEMHGGSVTAASEGDGQGSTFTVTLPVLAGCSAAAQPDVSDVAQTSVPRRILVVDDNRDGADSLAMMLRLLGNEVVTANDGIEAIQLAEHFGPEIVLMDVGMPRLDGLEATQRIRSLPWSRNMTIIALTGWGQEGDRERSRDAGCDGHMVKPVNLHDLEKLLTDVTQSQRNTPRP